MRTNHRLAALLSVAAAAGLLACSGGGQSGQCDPGTTNSYTAADTSHVPVGTDVTYSSNPPSIGQHYPSPLPGGVYTSPVLPEYYVHDLEHGAIVMLYDCDGGCADIVNDLRNIAEARPADAGGVFRYLISPQDGMPTPIAVVAWGWVYRSECVDVAEINAFIDAHYRQAPEDVPLP